MTKVDLNYKNVGKVVFKSGYGIMGDPCYWWGEDDYLDNDKIDYKSKLGGLEYVELCHKLGHSGAGMFFKANNPADLYISYATEEIYGKYTNVGRPAIYVLSFDGREPPDFTKFKDTDIYLDVDAGITYFGDCDAMFGEEPEEDICDGWLDFTEKYFDRSGYNNLFGFSGVYNKIHMIKEYIKQIKNEIAKDVVNFYKINIKSSIKSIERHNDYKFTHSEEDIENLEKEVEIFSEKYMPEYPAFSMYTYKTGENLGCIVDTNYGDGTYQVKIHFNEKNEVTHIMVVYDLPLCYDNEYEEEDEE